MKQVAGLVGRIVLAVLIFAASMLALWVWASSARAETPVASLWLDLEMRGIVPPNFELSNQSRLVLYTLDAPGVKMQGLAACLDSMDGRRFVLPTSIAQITRYARGLDPVLQLTEGQCRAAWAACWPGSIDQCPIEQ